MLNRLRRIVQRLSNMRWALVNNRPIARIPWSAIRRIGQSRLLALTIVVPFLGSLLLFNHHIVDLLTLSPELVARWFGVSPTESGEAARRLTLSRLYYVYFGLSFLGVGSALFVLFCPLNIKNYASSIDFQNTEAPLVSNSRMSIILPEVAGHYIFWEGDGSLIDFNDPDAPWYETTMLQRLGGPENFSRLFAVAILEIYVDKCASDVDEDGTPVIDEDDAARFEDRRGRPDAWRIAPALYAGTRLDEPFKRSMQNLANTEKYRFDILALQYMGEDHTKPIIRMVVAGFYALGFALLLIPTVATFCRVVVSLVS